MSRTALILIPLSLVSVACSSPNTSTGSPTTGSGGGLTCAQREGTYSEQFAERSGNCGALSEQIIATSQANPPPLPQGCVVALDNVSADNCTIDLDLTCPGSTGFHVTQRGTVHWSADGTSATGVLQFLLTVDATGLTQCSSSYDVTFKKL